MNYQFFLTIQERGVEYSEAKADGIKKKEIFFKKKNGDLETVYQTHLNHLMRT